MRLTLVAWLALAGSLRAEPIDFAREIAPLFQQHCIRCHQPGNKKGDFSLATSADFAASGFAVAGKPEESRLLQVIQTAKGETQPQMPKQARALTPDEVGKIRRWIEAGAKWPQDVAIRERSRADGNWWSLQPIKPVVPPNPTGLPKNWGENPIDRFIFAQLQGKQLHPNRPAERPALIRRLTYDLIGLPPTPEEVDAFVRDTSPTAYDKLVDRLLASPRYGEQWGRHWLDVVRFGESNGYERNVVIDNLWPFRDYIIKAINEDRPFDQLVQEHLAADVVAKDQPERQIGTAFLVCGPYDNVGNSDAVQAAIIRANHLDEMVRATSEAFLGLTFGCARCHDHKFDPITQADYTAWTAIFTGVRHGDRIPTAKVPGWPNKIWNGTLDANSAKIPTQIFLGGDPQKKGPTVPIASPAIFKSMKSAYALPASSTESERRVTLAKWIVASDNPLTSRVLVNRLWHYHFGTGLVDSPSDYGWMGSKPSHPELLDWLASQLLNEGWKWKPIHKLIVMSQAYRQSSEWNANAAKVDADSRLLWRFPPRRLSGEEVRDTMLTLAGQLDHDKERGGPGFRLYKYVQDNVATYIPLDSHGPETFRRAVYHQNARAARVDVLSDFDCPDPAAAAPRRATTTTPLQALALLNHKFVHDMSQRVVARLEREAGDKVDSRVNRLFALAYNRTPTPVELQSATALVEKHGLRPLVLAIMNSSELLYLP